VTTEHATGEAAPPPGRRRDTRAEARLFESRVRRVAQQHDSVGRGNGTDVLGYLDGIAHFLRTVRASLSSNQANGTGNPYAAEWLLDNFHIVDQSIRQVREDMPPSYYRQLPELRDSSPRYPRAYALARAAIAECDARLNLEWVGMFLRVYQSVTPITTGELWALPVMFRLCILETLARATAAAVDATAPPIPAPAPPLPDRVPHETLVANAIVSLRALAVEDWEVFIESVSLVDDTLKHDPAGVYAEMDFVTRDRYRGVVEEISRRSGKSEIEVARQAIELAQDADSSGRTEPSRAGHVGYYLVDSGRRTLESAVGYRTPLLQAIGRLLQAQPALSYLGAIGLVSIAILLALLQYGRGTDAGPWQSVALFLLLLVPSVTIGVSLVNWVVTHATPPRLLPKLRLEQGVPPDLATFVVVPALLSGRAEVDSLLDQLEQHYLRNPDDNLHFALLTDFTDGPSEVTPEDEELLDHARRALSRLNLSYRRDTPGPFYLFHRHRRWNGSEGVWMGWERKRGKLQEFNDLLLRRDTHSDVVLMGDFASLPPIRFVITLDADTIMPQGSARRLVGTLAHPLNRVEFDPGTGRVRHGYTVLQPRTEVKPVSASRSFFARISAGDSGLDLYTRAVSDVYQDWFGEGIFVGKGIYDLAGFDRSLAGKVPDNALLSHDLFEGIQGRAGLVTDVVLYEDYPAGYLESTHRMHRWIRGDWQLLPWLLTRPSGSDAKAPPPRLRTMDLWKIADNLRRSLLDPTVMLLLAAIWLGAFGTPFAWTLVALLALAAPLITGVVGDLVRGDSVASLRMTMRTAGTLALRWLLELITLPYEAWVTVDAVATTLVRLLITHRKLLQWTTAAHTARIFGRDLRVAVSWRAMSAAPLQAVLLAIVLALVNPSALPVAAPFLLLWFVSPQVAHWISLPRLRERERLSTENQDKLRLLARHTWFFFEQFVGPNDHWLPPDHFQESPRGLVAHRTSPTNIGMLLLSTLAAYDFGYVSPVELVVRLSNTLDTLSQLEHHRGHLLNWYDTRSLQPLPARYVSTVDSGNYLASLLTVRQGLLEVRTAPVLRWQHWQGVLDTLTVLSEAVRALSDEPSPPISAVLDHVEVVRRDIRATKGHPERRVGTLMRLLGEYRSETDRLLLELLDSQVGVMDVAALRELRTWSDRVHYQLAAMQHEYEQLVPWLRLWEAQPPLFRQLPAGSRALSAWLGLVESLPASPQLDEIEGICTSALARIAQLRGELLPASPGNPQAQTGCAWCDELEAMLQAARTRAVEVLEELDSLVAEMDAIIEATDFTFLYNKRRGAFHIGYNVDSARLDPNYYDLLASEARIASLLAISKGDAPVSHWLSLSRPVTETNGMRALLSWSGTMFEYLMPYLLMHHYDNTLLQQSCQAAVARQIEYATQQGVPWGVSESGFYEFDDGLSYQYRAFGVPGLGLKRGLHEDLVITPYACLLGLPIEPSAVVRNLERLESIGMRGLYGLYEAADFTKSRLPAGQKQAIVRSYMAHHQGMILLSLANHLEGDSLVRRFHQDRRVRSVELLLHEQVPHLAPLQEPPREEPSRVGLPSESVAIHPWEAAPRAPFPQVHAISNSRYSVVLTAAGSGYSRWRDMDLTRWRADTTLEDHGAWIYLQDLESGELWSVGEQPVAGQANSRTAHFSPHSAVYRTGYQEIDAVLDITVPPNDDLEIRRLRLTNRGEAPRRIFVSSYAEVILAPQDADRRHPVFNGLFIESLFRPQDNALLFSRRPRSSTETPPHLIHALIVEPGRPVTGAHETDRARFLGRNRSLTSPAALSGSEPGLSGTVGAVLDPIMSLGQVVELAPHSSAEVAFLTGAGESRRRVVRMAEHYSNWVEIERAYDRARSKSEQELRQLELRSEDLVIGQRLLSLLLYPHPAKRSDAQDLARSTEGQSRLWPYAISGDHPILLVRISNEEEVALVSALLDLHAYWRNIGLRIDLVILNEKESGYAQEIQGRLHRLLGDNGSEAWLNRRGGIFLAQSGSMPEADQLLLLSAARVVLRGDGGSLEKQLEDVMRPPTRLPAFVPTPGELDTRADTPPVPRPEDLQFDNGLGGFTPDGREYVIYLRPGEKTPAPWVNVIANEQFGFLVSESGSGYTWALNSGENRLTPWSNDPVLDPAGEALYLRDEESAAVWSPTPLPAGEASPHLVRHGAGYSVFEHNSHGIRQRLRLFAAVEDPVKVVHVRLENVWDRPRRITATYFAEWVLGVSRDASQQYVIPEYDGETHALLARNSYNSEFGGRLAFLASSLAPHGLTADRTEFLGRLGDRRRPAALQRIGLAGTVQPGTDPCAAIQVHIDLAPGEAAEFHFLVGQGDDRQAAMAALQRYRTPESVAAAWNAVQERWDSLLGAVTVETPEPAMDIMLNRWLLYQSLSCRIWGRSGFFQSSGAFGFRDQLQDVLALLHTAPELARDQILRAAAHQFEEGDVLHWWHPPSGRGVRTHIADDLLWLPFVTAHYVETTGDESILSEAAPYLRGDELAPGEDERYGHFETTEEVASLYDHCRAAIRRASTRGSHGLPLMGGGDWNDGMNRVGIQGKGESVWLGWFLYDTLTRFAAIAKLKGDIESFDVWKAQAEELQGALEKSAWDGDWYRRAYYDAGAPMGSRESLECQIDSISQSWAALSGAGDPERVRQALTSVRQRLVRDEDRLILLLEPPFDRTPLDPGYIKGYPPGIRENGGQYTHAATWLACAYASRGDGTQAEALYQLLNPIHHADTTEKAERYRGEPYVVAADIYSVPPHVGRAGWTWYTGSAAWLHRLGLEYILGLSRRHDRLAIRPAIPGHWEGYKLSYRHGTAIYHITVTNPDRVDAGVRTVMVDGEVVPGNEWQLRDDGREHTVEVIMGR